MPDHPFYPDAIPAQLKQHARWVCWRYEARGGEKPAKVPYCAAAVRMHASTTDPGTWTSFELALAAYTERQGQPDAYTGLGFVLAHTEDRIVGVDLDGCVVDGVPSPQAMKLLEDLDARYFELSPSGNGLRAFGYGEPLATGASGVLDGVHVELYSSARYLTVTGRALKSGPLAELRGFQELAQRLRTRNLSAVTAEVKGADAGHAELVRRILCGEVYHDSLRDLAASCVRAGMQGGAVVAHLRALMAVVPAEKQDARWTARLADIPDLVASAQRKFQPADRPTVTVELSVPEAPAVVHEQEEPDHHRSAPRADPACLYGLIGDIAKAGSDNTEANPYAIALNAMAYLSTAIGRGPFTAIGNTRHHARLFTLHVGRTGRGRKGDATTLIQRIDAEIRTLDKYVAPQIHSGGLSTREGLALMIHDGWTAGKQEVAPIHDKRLWVIESEFANVLHQGKRDGNTLSTALRDAWDGIAIKPAIKSQPRVWASNPHIGVSGAVTPKELLDLLAARELSNGFANRFVVIWAERSQKLAYPTPTPHETVRHLAERCFEVIRFAGGDRWAERDVMEIGMTPRAVALYQSLYHTELTDELGGDRITSLLERRAPVLRRLAMLFALCDLQREVDVPHVEAALAWVRYWSDSIRFIFMDAAQETVKSEVATTAQKILDFLAQRGRASRSELSKECFNGHAPKARLDAAIDELLHSSPPDIEVETVKRKDGGGAPSKFYRLPAKCAKSAKSEPWRGPATRSFPGELREISEMRRPPPAESATTFRSFRETSEVPNAAAARAGTHISLISHPPDQEADAKGQP